ncbi:hypothetical protein [Lutibacter citreus]|nr:hypothetical protein [Lutibacter citreus]
MKNIKLIFGILLVAGFFATIAMTNNSSDNQAIRKDKIIIPRQG